MLPVALVHAVALAGKHVHEQQQQLRAIQKRRRQQRLREALVFLRAACLEDGGRRKVERTEGGWKASTLNGYVENGDEQTYKLNFRATRRSVELIAEKLSSAGYLVDNNCRDPAHRMTSKFKVAVCLYYMAHAKGDAKLAGDVASLGKSTVQAYIEEFCRGVMAVLRPIYMPKDPPSASTVRLVREQFSGRHGISNVAMAVDGTHLPFRGGPDYRNYKGWTSILLVAFVSSYYTFVDGEVGAPGRAGDNTVLTSAWLMEKIREDPEAWLGADGVIAADGGASDGGELLLNPIPNAEEADELYYNFCHSSTRFFVEETFGRFKNRFRFLLYQSDLSQRTYCRLVYSAMILHNMFTILKDDAVDFESGTDDEWEEFFETYARMACPECTRRNKLHCPHVAFNRSAPAAKGGDASAKRDAIKSSLWEKMTARGDADALFRDLLERRAARAAESEQ